MQKVDFIVTGAGLAGSSIAYELVKRGYKVVRITTSVRPASMAAYGMLNPVHIRNAQLSWKARELYSVAVLFYRQLQKALQVEFFKETEIFHILTSEQEAIRWRQQAETGMLCDFCDGEIVNSPDSTLNAPLGCIKITGVLYIDVPLLLHHLQHWLESHHSPLLVCEPHEQKWSYDETGVRMNEFEARFVIHCQGVSASGHTLWKNIPFRPCKGEVLTLQFHDFVLQHIIHRKIFLIPQPDGTCKAGATYEWNDLTDTPTHAGANEILKQIALITPSSFTIKQQVAGVRPAVADRRPVVGIHPLFPTAAILNGYGSRGLILNPYCCQMLVDHLLHQKPILDEINVKRFYKRLLSTEISV